MHVTALVRGLRQQLVNLTRVIQKMVRGWGGGKLCHICKVDPDCASVF